MHVLILQFCFHSNIHHYNIILLRSSSFCNLLVHTICAICQSVESEIVFRNYFPSFNLIFVLGNSLLELLIRAWIENAVLLFIEESDLQLYSKMFLKL